jgi:hypothetical protein
MTTVSLVAVALMVGVTALDAQDRGNSSGRGYEPGNRPATPPGLDRQVHQVPEPATLTLLGLAVGGGLLARGLHARRRRA